MNEDKQSDLELPKGLVDRLKQADKPPPMITAKADRRVSTLAHEQFATRTEKRVSAPIWLSAAATVLLAVFIVQMQPPEPPESALYSDVDGSGQVDIADVMAMALRDPDASEEELDAFAAYVVSLGDAS